MKKLTQRIQHFSQKANEIRQVIEGVPPKINEVRDAVTAATGHVQQLRSDIVSSIATLRSENDTQLITALREIDHGADVLAQAGVRLEGVDMDLGPTRRLVVHLERVTDVHVARLRALLDANNGRATIRALLAALIKADELSDKVELTYLSFTKLTVDIGMIPSVKIGWRTEMMEEHEPAPAISSTPGLPSASRHPTAQPGPAPTVTAAPQHFFDRRPSASTPAKPVETPTPGTPPPATAPATAKSPEAAPSAASRTQDWRHGALDRFKKMPALGGHPEQSS